MTFKEYFLEHQNTGGFFTIDEFTTAYPTIDRAANAQLMTMLSAKIVAIAGQLDYEPVWSYPDALGYEIENVAFLNQYPIEKIYEVVKAGFNEIESETKKGDNTSVQAAEASTFKSFPQVTALDLYNENKIGKNSSNGSINDIIDEQRNLKREYNSKDNTEYLAHLLSDTLELIAKDYVKLTALNGIYFRPDSL